jgi:ribonuclease BN (tRNA processing enzyme)
MKIHCLGTSGYHPNEQRHTTCYFLPESGLVLDAGSGFYRLPPLVQTDHLDIVLSHAHLDHVVGLTFLLDVLHQRPIERVRVWGQAEKLAAIRDHLFHPLIFPVQLDVQWCPIELDTVTQLTSGVEATAFPLEHPGAAFGYRFDWPRAGKSLAYVTDSYTQLDAPWIDKLRGVDLLMHECNFRDEKQDWAIKTGHTWTTRACEVARTTEAKALMMIHINPLEEQDDPVGLETARSVFPQTLVARDNALVEF